MSLEHIEEPLLSEEEQFLRAFLVSLRLKAIDEQDSKETKALALQLLSEYEQEEDMFTELINGRDYTPHNKDLEMQKWYIQLALLEKEYYEEIKRIDEKT